MSIVRINTSLPPTIFLSRCKLRTPSPWLILSRVLNVPPGYGTGQHSTAVVVAVGVVFDSQIQRIILATEGTTMTRQVSHRPIKCQSRLWSQRGTKVNESHLGDNPLLRPRGIQITTKSLPGPTDRGHRKLIGVKSMSLGTNYSIYCLDCFQYFRI